jgi:hypothetical protein
MIAADNQSYLHHARLGLHLLDRSHHPGTAALRIPPQLLVRIAAPAHVLVQRCTLQRQRLLLPRRSLLGCLLCRGLRRAGSLLGCLLCRGLRRAGSLLGCLLCRGLHDTYYSRSMAVRVNGDRPQGDGAVAVERGHESVSQSAPSPGTLHARR